MYALVAIGYAKHQMAKFAIKFDSYGGYLFYKHSQIVNKCTQNPFETTHYFLDTHLPDIV